MGDAMNQTEYSTKPTIVQRKLHRWRMAFFGLVILLAGIVIGAASMLILAPHRLMRPPQGPEIASERMIPRLRHLLGLSSEQMEKLEPILQKHMQRLHEIRMGARSEITEQLHQMNEEISALLTEEQKQLWQQNLHHLQRQLRPPGPRQRNGMGEHRYRRGRQERFQRDPKPFGPPPPANRPAIPGDDINHNTTGENERTTNEDL